MTDRPDPASPLPAHRVGDPDPCPDLPDDQMCLAEDPGGDDRSRYRCTWPAGHADPCLPGAFRTWHVAGDGRRVVATWPPDPAPALVPDSDPDPYGPFATEASTEPASASRPLYRPGDSDPTPGPGELFHDLGAPSPCCAARLRARRAAGGRSTFYCTWSAGHPGAHVAGDGAAVAATWSADEGAPWARVPDGWEPELPAAVAPGEAADPADLHRIDPRDPDPAAVAAAAEAKEAADPAPPGTSWSLAWGADGRRTPEHDLLVPASESSLGTALHEALLACLAADARPDRAAPPDPRDGPAYWVELDLTGEGMRRARGVLDRRPALDWYSSSRAETVLPLRSGGAYRLRLEGVPDRLNALLDLLSTEGVVYSLSGQGELLGSTEPTGERPAPPSFDPSAPPEEAGWLLTRTWAGEDEPAEEGLELVDRDGDVWRRLGPDSWAVVRRSDGYLPSSPDPEPWDVVRGYAPLTDLRPPPAPGRPGARRLVWVAGDPEPGPRADGTYPRLRDRDGDLWDRRPGGGWAVVKWKGKTVEYGSALGWEQVVEFGPMTEVTGPDELPDDWRERLGVVLTPRNYHGVVGLLEEWFGLPHRVPTEALEGDARGAVYAAWHRALAASEYGGPSATVGDEDPGEVGRA